MDRPGSGSYGTNPARTRAELILGLALTALILGLHGVWFRHAGGLWRDEVVSVELASVSSLAELWNSLKFESFPPLMHLLLRLWMELGLPVHDVGLRAFGCLLGLTIVAALWASAALLGARAPLFSLSLFALSGLTIRTSDSVRSYGLGIALLVLAFPLLWCLLEETTAARLVAAALVAFATVHCLYQGAFFLLALGGAALLIALRCRRWAAAAAVTGIGLAAALSLLVYRSALQEMSSLKILIPYEITVGRIATVLYRALSASGAIVGGIWIASVAVGPGLAIALGRSNPSARDRRLLSYASATMLGAALAYLVFLQIVNMPTQPWYYLPLMALWAVCLDGIWGVSTGPCLRSIRLLIAAGVAAVALLPSWNQLHLRQTNVDLIAAKLTALAGGDDYIVVHPWYCGATFARYYRGPSPWTTVPPHPEPRMQRLDLFRDAMLSPDPMRPVIEKASATLQSGHRLWLVGGLPEPSADEGLLEVGPAPSRLAGWDHDRYAYLWAARLDRFLRQHATKVVSMQIDQGVNPYERLRLFAVRGWRDASTDTAAQVDLR